MRTFASELCNMTYDELQTLRAEHYTYDATVNHEFWADVRHYAFRDERSTLISYYCIQTDADGRYTYISTENAQALAKESLTDAARYLVAKTTDTKLPYFDEDDHDHLNAATDQVNFCTRVILNWDDDAAELILDCINNTDDTCSEPTNSRVGFQLGYADHDSVISTLAHLND